MYHREFSSNAGDGCANAALDYLSAFDSRDPRRIASFVTDDFVNEHTSALGGGSQGKAAYLERLPGFLATFIGLHYEPEAPVSQGDRVALPYLMTARYQGDHDIALRGVFLLRFRGGLIAHRVDYWDSLSFLRQIGQAPG